MSTSGTVDALISAIERERFRDIAELHQAGAALHTFRGPTAWGGVAIGEWYGRFLRDYADCSYTERSLVEDGEVAALRATIEAKGYDWRVFEQHVLEFVEFEEGLISARRIYAMPARIEYPKPALDALQKLEGTAGGGPAPVAAAARGFVDALLEGDRDGAAALLADDAVLIDGVFGVATGSEAVLELVSTLPSPAFGTWRLLRCIAGENAAALELAIDPQRPRAGAWIRVNEERVAAIEMYWMLREIGVTTGVVSIPRHPKQVILPI